MFLQNESWRVNESKWEWIWQAVGQGTWKLSCSQRTVWSCTMLSREVRKMAGVGRAGCGVGTRSRLAGSHVGELDLIFVHGGGATGVFLI